MPSPETPAAGSNQPPHNPARWADPRRTVQRVRVPLGFLVAALFLLLAKPTVLSLLLSLPLVAAGLSLRAAAAGYVRKNAELTTTGPYAYTRNPLYLGSLGMLLGFAVAAANGWLALALLAVFALIYIPTILAEEQFLRAQFPAFPAYAAAVPRLLPRLTAARCETATADRPGRRRFSAERYRHHREYNAGIGAAAIYAVLLAKLAIRHLHHP